MIQQFLASTTSDTITKMRRLERSLKALDLSNRVKGNRSVMFDSLKRMVDALSALLEAGLTSDMVHASQVSFLEPDHFAITGLAIFRSRTAWGSYAYFAFLSWRPLSVTN